MVGARLAVGLAGAAAKVRQRDAPAMGSRVRGNRARVVAVGAAFEAEGADIIFLEAPESEDEMRRFCQAMTKPCMANMVPGGGVLIEGLSSLGEKAKNRKVLDKALNSKPEMKAAATVLATDYPGLAAALGIGYLSQEMQSSSSSESRNR